MRLFIIIWGVTFSIFVQNCTTQKVATEKYPNCSSSDIEKMDTCLLEMTLRQALNKLNLDTSKFYVIEEPIAALRGISFRPNDSTQVNLYVEKTLIKKKYDLFRMQDSLNLQLKDSLKFNNRYLFIIDKQIKTVSWTKNAGGTYKTIHVPKNE